MTAGHNAVRGSGPGQKDAFNDALARVGCPDRRIDRLCFTTFYVVALELGADQPGEPWRTHHPQVTIEFIALSKILA